MSRPADYLTTSELLLLGVLAMSDEWSFDEYRKVADNMIREANERRERGEKKKRRNKLKELPF